MRVGYDEQVFLAQPRGGISRYFVEVIKAFRSDESLGVDPIPGWRWSPNAHAAEAGLSRPIPKLDGRGSTALGQAGYYLANTGRRRSARHAEILHHTYTHERFFQKRFTGVRVVTVYDMIPEIFPKSFSGRNPHLAKQRYVAESDVILCISEATRRDVIAIYGETGRPMPVTYLGVDPGFSPSRQTTRHLPDRFLLFVGQRHGYKDFAVLAEAFAGLPHDSSMLVAVGGGEFTEAESQRLAKLGIADRVRQIDATDADLPGIYAAALAFVFPSRYEGFGLPTLEAMASGIAVVLADSSSHPEVGGEVARYFPPQDAEALRAILAELLEDPDLRSRLGRDGVLRAREFSWQSTARATAAAYHGALASTL